MSNRQDFVRFRHETLRNFSDEHSIEWARFRSRWRDQRTRPVSGREASLQEASTVEAASRSVQ